MQQKKTNTAEEDLFLFQSFYFAAAMFQKGRVSKKISCLSSSVIPDILLCLSLPMENEVCLVCAYLESKIILIKYA